jgi:hypothetical protein
MPKARCDWSALIDLPVTLEDYVAFCQNKDFSAIRSVSEKLSAFESRLAVFEPTTNILNDVFGYILSIIPLGKNTQVLMTDSFVKASERFEGKSIFMGFISERTKYIEGVMISLNREEVIIIYLPIPPNCPKVMYSPSLVSKKVIDTVMEFAEAWKREAIDSVKMENIV